MLGLSAHGVEHHQGRARSTGEIAEPADASISWSYRIKEMTASSRELHSRFALAGSGHVRLLRCVADAKGGHAAGLR